MLYFTPLLRLFYAPLLPVPADTCSPARSFGRKAKRCTGPSPLSTAFSAARRKRSTVTVPRRQGRPPAVLSSLHALLYAPFTLLLRHFTLLLSLFARLGGARWEAGRPRPPLYPSFYVNYAVLPLITCFYAVITLITPFYVFWPAGQKVPYTRLLPAAKRCHIPVFYVSFWPRGQKGA